MIVPSPFTHLSAFMTAGAAHTSRENWAQYIGEMLLEVSYADYSQNQLETFLAQMEQLLVIKPELWNTCGRAHAVLKPRI